MSYNNSQTDKNNFHWFPKDDSKSTLLCISLNSGHLRGLYPFELNFKYPISVIAGKNGSGKSTLLALVACAFHNDENGFKLSNRKNTYYTFSDFFIQAKEEIPPEGIVIKYKILNNNWVKSKKHPDGKGVGWQKRYKRTGGKWNKYSRRVKRNVVYFGIDRVLPHSEKSVSKTYKNRFENIENQGWETEVKNLVAKILNKEYEKFWFKEHSKYRLPIVKTRNNLYSGFNMGAGENALFEIFSTIYSCPSGVLLVIDEIELGLHEEAQTRLIEELKKICKDRQIQIICTTHSYNVLKCVPPDARFFLENLEEKTIVTPCISPSYASGKMAGENSNELDIFIEDSVASYLLNLGISNSTRNRVNIIPIGSSSAVTRLLSARYKNIKTGECIAILDGDKSDEIKEICRNFLNLLENPEDKNAAESWIKERLNFLPENTWPEKWILTVLKENENSELTKILSVDEHELNMYIDEALRADKHNEFFSLCKRLNLDKEFISRIFCTYAIKFRQDQFTQIEDYILKFLD